MVILLFNTETGRHRGAERVWGWRRGGVFDLSTNYTNFTNGFLGWWGGYRKVNVPVNLAPEERSFLFSAKPCGLLVDREVDLPG